ncbi:hypothetical protein PQX77_007748 [Marasmius sp. AFHP31]|nr:hypothetical protein PQX77_007748 [Marasmius sp. AFHP31]
MASRISCWSVSAVRRFSSSATRLSNDEVRQLLTSRIKDAMKSRNQLASTTLRSILSEVNNADKTSNAPIPSSAIVAIIRKAHLRRTESASVFDTNSRPDLAEKELKEAAILDEFLPALLTSEQIDNHVNEILATIAPEERSPKAVGRIFKTFYSKVDRSTVDSELVKSRVNAILSAHTS